jgi:hypothetical protein
VTTIPQAYYQFVMDYAPYVYVIPPDTPDTEWGKAAFATAFAIDFLYEAYFNQQFEDRRTEIKSKIVNLADWILTQQCTDDTKLAYGGFKSNENSTHYYSVDACRVIPSILKAYELTNNTDYLNAAVLAGATFLYNMQHKPSQLGVHDKYYGGFARAVTNADAWLQQMDIESLYGLIGLKMLYKHDSSNKSKYETMITDAIDFYRSGFEQFYLYYDPPPNGDADWHRVDSNENTIYDDSFAYALLGLYNYEGWSTTVQKIYNFINAIGASAQYPAYNPAVCWAGYIDVITRSPACNYYDAVTAGILWKIRKERDKPSLWFSMKIINMHQNQFMYWGVKQDDFGFVENKKAMATVCWLSLMYLNYTEPSTRFRQVLRSKGENVTLYSIVQTGEKVSYGEPLGVKAIVSPTRIGEILIESGYLIEDYITAYVFTPLRHHDKLRWKGKDYEVQSIQPFSFKGETAYFKAVCRRLISS